jgi:hypothetical protein
MVHSLFIVVQNLFSKSVTSILLFISRLLYRGYHFTLLLAMPHYRLLYTLKGSKNYIPERKAIIQQLPNIFTVKWCGWWRWSAIILTNVLIRSVPVPVSARISGTFSTSLSSPVVLANLKKKKKRLYLSKFEDKCEHWSSSTHSIIVTVKENMTGA